VELNDLELAAEIRNSNVTLNGNFVINNSVIGLKLVGDTNDPSLDKASVVTFNKSVTINNTLTAITAMSGSSTSFNDNVVINQPNIAIEMLGDEAAARLYFANGLSINNEIKHGMIIKGKNNFVTFNGNAAIDALIQTEIDDQGVITFDSAPTISRSIGEAAKKLQLVDFTLNDIGQRIYLSQNIYATNINMPNLTIGIDNNLTLGGNLSISNSNLDLNDKTVTLDGTMTSDQGSTVKISTLFDGYNAGHFALSNNISSGVDLSHSSKITFNITETPGAPMIKAGEVRIIDMFAGNGISNLQLLDQNNIDIVTNNPFVKWSIDTREGTLSQRLKGSAIDDLFKIVDSDGSINSPLSNQDLIEELYNIILSKGPLGGAETINKLNNNNIVATSTAPLNEEANLVDNRLFNVVGAGDEEPIYGAWFAPIYGKATQKKKLNQSGFKSHYTGGIIGFDSKLDNYLTVGIAGSISDGKIRHNDTNLGDKTKYVSYVGLIYLSYDLSEQWYMQNTFAYGYSKVHNSEVRISVPNNMIAKANYSERRISNNIGFGYKKILSDDMLLIPFFALDVNRLGSVNYTETGAGIQNLKFSRKSMMQFDGILGARLSRVYEYKDYEITPAIVANIRYALSQRKLTLKLSWHLMTHYYLIM
jgi:hypothetical protein